MMSNLTRFVGRGAALALVPWILLASCGSGDSSGSSFTGGGDAGFEGGGGGDDGSGFGGDDGGGGGGSAAGAPTTCIVGTQGCLCDDSGGCAPNLTCTPQPAPRPNLCCSGSNCTATTGGSIGKSCSPVSGVPSCTPGVTVPPASGTTDSCGYPIADFVESSTICAITASGGGTKPAIVRIFYNDEHALTLGCATASAPVSPLSTDPAAVHYPQTGDPACTDTVGRPLRPVLFVTDLSGDPNCTAGDLQKGGTAYNPIAVFGSWKSATEEADGGTIGTPEKNDPATNGWNLTASADPPPPGVTTTCNQGYSAELRYEVGLISGHSYRLQVIAHDGDQNKGGDSGEACAVFCAGTGPLCDPGVTVCANGSACPAGTACVQGCCLSDIK